MLIVNIDDVDYETDTQEQLQILYEKMRDKGIEAGLLWEITTAEDGTERRVPTDAFLQLP